MKIYDNIRREFVEAESIGEVVSAERYQTVEEVLIQLVEEIEDYAYWMKPAPSDYYYQGIAEAMVLDRKAEIADDLYTIVSKYKEGL